MAGALALGVGVAAAVAMAGHWALTTPRFAVMAVEVRGASRVPPQRILEVSGIVRGTNLWRIDPETVRARLEALPEIRRCSRPEDCLGTFTRLRRHGASPWPRGVSRRLTALSMHPTLVS
jgi:hypothetical protein